MILTQAQRDAANTFNPEVADFMAKNPRPPEDFSSPEPIKKVMAAMSSAGLAKLGSAPTGVEENYHKIPMRDGYESSIKIHKPTNTAHPGPLVILCFGGGFVGGDNNQLTPEARALVSLFGATVVTIDYRLAPEWKYPYAQHDAWDSCAWIAENATTPQLNANPSLGFLIGGVSAGGAIAASLSRQFQETPLKHPLTGQWLCIPSIMDAASCPEEFKSVYTSPEDSATSPVLSKAAREALTRWCEWDTTSPLRYAVISNTDIAAQPKTYFQVDGLDPLRDDALIYDEMLNRAGVQTKVDLYEGCPHGHWAAMPDLGISKKARVDCIVGFGWLLGKEVSREQAAKTLGISQA